MKTIHFIIALLATFTLNVASAQIANGVYFIHLSNGFVMEAEGGTYNTDGCKIQNWGNNNGINQKWEVTRMTNGAYRIKNLGSNKMLDAAAQSLNTNGGKVQLWQNYPTNRNQEWVLTQVSPGRYAIRNAASTGNKVLDVTGYAIGTHGTAIQLWDYSPSNTSNQIWTFLPTARPTIIPRATWLNPINTIFNTSRVRLNNYTGVQNQYFTGDREFFKPNDSWFRFYINGREFSYPIDIPMQPLGPDLMFKAYVNDWNSDVVTTATTEGNLRVNIRFEDAGKEIITRCYNNFNCGFVPAPIFDFSNSDVRIYLKPMAVNGRLSYTADVNFSTNISESGPCVNHVLAFLCPTDRNGLIKGLVEKSLKNHLNSDTIKPLLSAVLNTIVPVGTRVNAVQISLLGDLIIN